MTHSQAAANHETYGDPPVSRKVIVTSALIYPWWHLAAPATATDPWLAWWAVGSSFLIVEWATQTIPFVARHATRFLYLCAWLCTLQLFVLAFINDMRPFYVVGSLMSVISTSVFIRSRVDHLAFGAFVFVLSAVLFAIEPTGLKAAYWGGMFTIIVAAYFRLSAQLGLAQVTREHRERLEEAVMERTVELSEANRQLHREIEEKARLEEELRLSQKLEALGRLAGGVAHEFNNLLTRIRLYAEFSLVKAPPDSALREDIEEIQKAGRQAATLTRQLLTFSRRGDVHDEVMDMNSVIGESSTMLRHLLGEKVEFVCLLGDGPHAVCTDRGQLEQVLVNLVLNARDAMPDGGRFTIETSLVQLDGDGASGFPEALREKEYVLLAMSDTGIGMDSESRARAFDPFFTRKSVSGGTGLGLSIVYGIVNHAGGHVRVLSEPGKGARFELLWPSTRELPMPNREHGAKRRVRGSDERILLVEDEEELRSALNRVLTTNGYRVLDAAGPEAAIRIAEEFDGPIHLLLTDVVMSEMNGVDLADRVCAARPETRVLLISGYMDLRESLLEALPPGVAFLEKPFESEDLIADVRKVLDAPASGESVLEG